MYSEVQPQEALGQAVIFLQALYMGLILTMTSLEIPTPHKKITKSLDINDVSVK